jgi:hypothetical protein
MPDRWPVRGLHLATLAGFAISQPIYDVLLRFPTFLVSHRLDSRDILLLTLLLSILLPAFVFGLSWLSHFLGEKLHRILHIVMLSILLIATLLPPIHSKVMDGSVAILLAGLATAGLSLAYARSKSLRRFVGWLALALFVFPALFLTNTTIRNLVFRSSAAVISTINIDGDAPIVLLIFDEFPVVSLMDEYHQVDPVRYPNFAALSEQSHWFRNTSTVAAFTEQAVPAILTGRFPEGDKLPIYEDYPQTLFTLLGGSYAMHVKEAVTLLYPPGLQQFETAEGAVEEGDALPGFLRDLRVVYLHILLPEEFTGDLPSVSDNWSGFNNEDIEEVQPVDDEKVRKKREGQLANLNKNSAQSRVDSALEFIRNISAEEPRTLHVLHTTLPHSTWRHTPSGRHYCRKCAASPGLVRKIWTEEDRYAQLGYQRHLMQVALADRILGKAVEQLKRIGLYDSALIVVTADHGASFWPETPFRHLKNSEHPSDILDVPLFVKLPGQKDGHLNDRHVRTIDILPAITQLLGMERPEGIDGYSIFDLSHEPATFKRARDDDGDFEQFDADADLKYASLERKLALFGSRDNGSIYAVGGHRVLLGEDISELDVAPESPWTIETDRNYFRNSAKHGKFAPAFVNGTVEGASAGGPVSVVAVVNGTIEAIARVVPEEDMRSVFNMVLPEDSFRVGNVDLQFLILDESDGTARFLGGNLAPIRFNQKALPAGYPSRGTPRTREAPPE